MATLADQLKRNRQQSQGLVRGPGGQLQQLTGAGIQQLAQARGLEAPPTSPLGGQAIGATPDQVKMLGDVRQKRAALDIGVTGGLAEARRTKQVRTEATGEELATFEKSVALQKLGPTGQKAGELIDVATASLSTTKLEKPLVSLSAAGRELAPDIQKLVISYVDGSGRTPETLNQIAAALKTTADKVNVLTYIDSNTLTVETTRELAAEMAKLAPDTVTLGQLYPTGVSANLGLTETELASLGITEAQLASYTMTQLQDFLAQQRTQLLSEPGAVRAGLADPNLSQAEREELRGQLRGLSAVGVLGVEQAVADLVAQIEAADQVTYRDPVTGETVTRAIGDLLADEEVSKLIIQFLGLTPEQQSKLLADTANPLANLYKWISGNADNIKALTTEGAEAFTGEQKQVQENVALANVSGFQLSDDLMTTIYGDTWNKFGAGKLDVNNYLYQGIAKSPDPGTTIKSLEDLLKADKDLFTQLFKSGNEKEVTNLLSKPASLTNYISQKQFLKKLASSTNPLPEVYKQLGTNLNTLRAAFVLDKNSPAGKLYSLIKGNKKPAEILKYLSDYGSMANAIKGSFLVNMVPKADAIDSQLVKKGIKSGPDAVPRFDLTSYIADGTVEAYLSGQLLPSSYATVDAQDNWFVLMSADGGRFLDNLKKQGFISSNALINITKKVNEYGKQVYTDVLTRGIAEVKPGPYRSYLISALVDGDFRSINGLSDDQRYQFSNYLRSVYSLLRDNEWLKKFGKVYEQIPGLQSYTKETDRRMTWLLSEIRPVGVGSLAIDTEVSDSLPTTTSEETVIDKGTGLSTSRPGSLYI